jgi:hypothetical protein
MSDDGATLKATVKSFILLDATMATLLLSLLSRRRKRKSRRE